MIQNFSSNIIVHADSRLTVTETITVNALGRKINRGIYRDLLTRHKDRLGKRVYASFYLKEVLRDGNPEPHHTQKTPDALRIYIGDKDVYLSKGVYTYRITYETLSQIGFFEKHDELYWNVTGNDWEFPIETAAVKITLPPGADIAQTAGYTGPLEAKGGDFRMVKETGPDIAFVTTKPLKPGEGFTVAVSWPKGFVSKPSLGRRIYFFLLANKAAQVCLAAVVLVLTYFLAAWFKAGRDPASKAIVPRFSPPDNLSPAVARFLKSMDYGADITSLSATILNMAVKGYLAIEETQKDRFTLIRLDKPHSPLSTEEQSVADQLFVDGRKRLYLAADRKSRVKEVSLARFALLNALEAEYVKKRGFFTRNSAYSLPGCLVSVALMIGLIWYATASVSPGTDGGRPGIAALLIFWTLGVHGGVAYSFKAWFGGKGYLSFFWLLLGLPFGAFSLFLMHLYGIAVSPVILATLVLVPTVNLIFSYLLKAPSRAGQEILDAFEGFKLYLTIAEQDRLNLLNPPEETPEVFSRFLPYALALEVEQAWCKRFDAMLAESNYRPSWYHGTRSTAAFSRSFSSGFSSALSSAGAAPGSSSVSGGSGGGGSSGGGGGGGGGGGW